MTAESAPDPMMLHPVAGQPRVVLLKPLIVSPLIEVGEFSYYDDPDFADEFETRNVLHHYGPERLVIGKFCALAAAIRAIFAQPTGPLVLAQVETIALKLEPQLPTPAALLRLATCVLIESHDEC